MNTDPSTPENDANLSALGRELLDTGGSKPSGPWVPPTAEELHAILPQYEIVKMLGRGGMGAVYMGTQTALERPVAIKILSAQLEESDMGFTERFKNEAKAMAKLNHPGIVAVYDFGEAPGGLLYIVMEYVDGTDVAKMLAAKGRLHTEHAMAITAHVCDALSYAHERGIIHRDIKPANIMVGYDGEVKVADFGLAKVSTDGRTLGLTQSGMAMGTLHYMAPEALMLGSAVDHRADIYAVGVMLYQMLSGKIPQGMFKMPSLLVAGLDPRYDGIIAKGIMEDREARYQSAREMRADLDGILTQPVVKVEPAADTPAQAAMLPTGARPQRPGGQTQTPAQSRRHAVAAAPPRSSLAWLLVTALVLAVLGGVGWLIFGVPRQPDAATTRPLEDSTPPSPVTPEKTSLKAPAIAASTTLSSPVPATASSSVPPTITETWQSLFNGKDLTGWQTNPSNLPISVSQGMILIRGVDDRKKAGDLFYVGTGQLENGVPQLNNFEVMTTLKTAKKGNSDLIIHAAPITRITGLGLGGAGSTGTAIQIWNEENPVGLRDAINELQYRTGSLWRIAPMPVHYFKDEEWFVIKARVEGLRLQVWVQKDGATKWIQTVDWTQPSNWTPPSVAPHARLGSGTIAFSNWVPVEGEVWIKDIQFRKLGAPVSSPVPAPTSPIPLLSVSETWQSLFNGKDLSGWRIIGNSRGFTVDQGTIMTGGVRADLIYTGAGAAPAVFRDFELRMQVKTGDKGNSGLWFHLPAGIQSTGEADQSLQVQIDNGLDQQRTGSIVHVLPRDHSPVTDGEWFELRTLVRQGTVTAFVDGKQVNQWTQPDNWQPPTKASLARMGAGAIGLESWKGNVWFKDIQLRVLDELPPATPQPASMPVGSLSAVASATKPAITPADSSGWQPLFANDSLSGWKGDVAGYRLANGILTSSINGGDLISPKEYGNFHLKFDLRLSSGSNNGIGIWCAEDKGPFKHLAHTGFEIQLIDDNMPTNTKAMPWQLHGATTYFISPKAKPMGPVGSWNTHEIRMDGTRLTVVINNVTVIDQELPTGDPVAAGSRRHRLDLLKKRGHLVFCGMQGPVDFRNVMIKDLDTKKTVVPAPPAAPAPVASATTWIDTKGRSLQAKFVLIEGDNVLLDIVGKTTPVALASLSDASRQIAETLRSASLPSTSKIPSDALSFGTSRYAYYPGTITWQEAKAKAETLGGHLAIITSEAEDAWVRSAFGAKVPQGKTFWIGAMQRLPNLPWQWVSSVNVDLTFWHPGEPNNATAKDAGKRTPPYYLTYYKTARNFGWNDVSESDGRWQGDLAGYLVEWDNAVSANSAAPDPEAGFVSLLDADEPGDWVQVGPGKMDIRNGVSTNTSPTKWGVSIYTKQKFSDFILKAEFRGQGPVFNSGLWLRMTDYRSDYDSVHASKYEVGICYSTGDLKRCTGAIWGVQPALVDALKANDWNELEVTATGQRYVVKLNGQLVNDFTGNKGTSGYIGLEENAMGSVQFRNVRVKPLP